MVRSRNTFCVAFMIAQFAFLISCQSIKINKCKDAFLSPSNDILTVPFNLMENNETSAFTLIEKTPNCAEMVSDVNDTIKFTLFGEVSLNDEYFSVDDFCISRVEFGEIQIKYCAPECGKSHVCIPKCCPLNEVLELFPSHHCRDPGEDRRKWNPTVYNSQQYTQCGVKEEGWKFHFRNEILSCDSSALLTYFPMTINFGEEVHDGLLFRFLTNGSAVFNLHKDWIQLGNGTYCIDRFQNDSVFLGDPNAYLALDCRNEEISEEEGSSISLAIPLSALMIFSSIFSFATVFVYLLLWDKHNIHGWTIFCFVFCMLMMFVFLATAHLTSKIYDIADSGSHRCVFIGVMTHFFFLSMFCWMTMINVDLFITFKRLSPTTTKAKGIQRFGYYLLFALGIPVTIVGISLILDSSLESEPQIILSNDTNCENEVIESNIILPEYGRDTCYLSEMSRGYYLYAPIGVLLSCNVMFFLATVYTLWTYKQSTKSAAQGSSSSQNKQSFILFIKLFFVMGLTWVFEVISWLNNNHNSIWLIFDILNLLSPVAIFYIFICKKEIVIKLYQKFPSLRGILKSGLPCCKIGLMDTEDTAMTGVERSKVHYRHSQSSY